MILPLRVQRALPVGQLMLGLSRGQSSAKRQLRSVGRKETGEWLAGSVYATIQSSL